jgi:uncharacterized cupredoxin-like copper-binding protein
MKLRMLSLALLVAAVSLVIAPAAISRTDAAKATTVIVTAKDFKFVLSKKTVPHGKVTFKVTNKGKATHDFKISGKKTKMIKPGKSATLIVTLSKGTKPYLCTVPGHAALGMKGKLKVT